MSDGHTKNKIIVLYEEQGGLCYYCKISIYEEAKALRTPQIDHKVSKVNGGTNEITNLCLTCRICNSSKGSKNEQEFMAYLKPYFDGLCTRKELQEYRKYKELKEKYEVIKNKSAK